MSNLALSLSIKHCETAASDSFANFTASALVNAERLRMPGIENVPRSSENMPFAKSHLPSIAGELVGVIRVFDGRIELIIAGIF